MNRFIDNYITTIIGLGVLIISGVLFYQSKIDAVSFGSMIALALTYIRAKDSILPGVEAK